VTGRADYVADVPVANLLHAVIVTSTVARGRITKLSVEPAAATPGVLKVLSHLNAPRLPGAAEKTGPVDRLLQVLQDDRVLYDDQPIAVVIADTLEHAQAAAQLVSAEYASEAPVTELASALGTAYTPKTAGPRDPADSKRGDVDGALSTAHARVDVTYTTAVQTHNPMEMHGAIAVWQGPDRLTLYDTSQGIFGARKKLAVSFGMKPENVRVISHYVGGGFGCKGSPWSHLVLCALAAREVGKPVKLVLSRQQMFALVGHRPRTEQHLLLAADSRGKLLAVRHEVTSDTSRFDEFSEPSGLQTRMLYSCPNVETRHRLVRVDLPTPTFTRAPGEATGTFALESAMDELAHELHMDPLALRIANHADRDEHEHKPWSSKSLLACYQQAAERFGWSRRARTPRAMLRGRNWMGWGMATATYPARQSPASARASMRRDGSVVVQAGSQDIGTGTYTILTQIAADALGVNVERVQLELGDTELPETPVSGGSQTAASTGSAVQRAALALRDQLVDAALSDQRSPLFGRPKDAIQAQAGALMARGSDARESYTEIVARSGNDNFTVRVDSPEKPERKQYSTHSFGAQFAEVAVDADTREIRVTRVVSAFAAGK
ncbi:MAG TPA: xanthine dehydrogenase family protein molybdopterin-binding subunit, partial [Polyangiaceae bacterium]|nr:xanthine dehydrogenase family protein molybdopterin-binding subunit [Polyangiaceae bacterium]